MSNPYQTSADTGEQANLNAHVTGDPYGGNGSVAASVGHTWLILAVALALLWLFGGVFFRSLRMG